MEEAQCVVGEGAGGLGLGRHLRNLVADRLELADRAAEGFALQGVVDGPLDQPLHRADGADRHQQPLPGEVGHDQFEALVFLAEQVLLRHLDVGEGQLARVG